MEEVGEAKKDEHENANAHQHLRTAGSADKAQDTIDAQIQNQYLYSIRDSDF
jgi:hypothetical protein